MMARFVHLTVIREAGDDLGKIDCSKQLDDDDIDIGQLARDHLQFADAEAAVIEENAVDHEGALMLCALAFTSKYMSKHHKQVKIGRGLHVKTHCVCF